jgi:hypothetical protein
MKHTNNNRHLEALYPLNLRETAVQLEVSFGMAIRENPKKITPMDVFESSSKIKSSVRETTGWNGGQQFG